MVAKKPLDTTYGKLTVIGERDGMALCKCACGNPKDVLADRSALRTGRIVSCGCRKAEIGERRRTVIPGRVYDRLTVTHREPKWATCTCSCGTTNFRTRASDLSSGRTTSCGCKGREHISSLARQNTSHGLSGSAEYQIWVDMHRRCEQPGRPDFHRYGGRGISVCREWGDFAKFFSDMGERPLGTTLDRRDNDGPYSKDNCYWATKKQQGRNTRNNRVITVAGMRMCMAEAVDRFGVPRGVIARRIRNGMTPDEAIAKPVKIRNRRK